MPTPFELGLDATLDYLHTLKAQGVRYVHVEPATMRALTEASAAPAAPASRTSFQAAASAPTPARAPAARPAFAEGSTAAPVSSAPAPVSSPAYRPEPATPPPSAPVAPAITRPTPAPAVPAAAASTPLTKLQAMNDLRTRALVCTRCPNLAAARRNVVFGVGDVNAQLMFVGEAPGMDEDAQGEPFVGAAGQLLTKIIVAMGLARSTVYIGNILKCRPDTPGQNFGNRKPEPHEMQTCIPYLEAQIDIIQPKVIVALGATAVEGLLGLTGISRLRGHWQTYRNIPLMPTFHPSFLLRSRQPMVDKRLVWEDMLQVMERLGMPISDKQRRFFLEKAA